MKIVELIICFFGVRLVTVQGNRLFLLNFGTGVHRFVFEPLDQGIKNIALIKIMDLT